jgi:phytol kinase
MIDLLLAIGWLVALAVAVGLLLMLRRAGLASTYARDLLHVGTGVWVLGWPLWSGRLGPLLIVSLAALLTLVVPHAARRSRRVAAVQRTFAEGDERWSGLVLYALAYAALTWVGLGGRPFAAAAGLLALSFGDGIGGAVGRRFGRHRFRVWGGKQKSLEGSVAVAIAATVGIGIAAWRFDVALGIPAALGLGMAAAVAEALSPRGTDNLFVPASVWGIAQAGT